MLWLKASSGPGRLSLFEFCRCRAVLIGLLLLWPFPLTATAAPETPLTTRFIQGSFDILLPERAMRPAA